jgi:hypothetical protein
MCPRGRSSRRRSSVFRTSIGWWCRSSSVTRSSAEHLARSEGRPSEMRRRNRSGRRAGHRAARRGERRAGRRSRRRSGEAARPRSGWSSGQRARRSDGPRGRRRCPRESCRGRRRWSRRTRPHRTARCCRSGTTPHRSCSQLSGRRQRRPRAICPWVSLYCNGVGFRLSLPDRAPGECFRGHTCATQSPHPRSGRQARKV